MNLVPLIQKIGNRIRRWSIHDCGRDNVRHVSVIAIPGDIELWVGIELADCSQVYIAAIEVSLNRNDRREHTQGL